MTLAIWYGLTGMALVTIGVYGLLARAHPMRQILAVNITGAGVFLVLVASAHRRPSDGVDPVPHAMVLTGVVVAICATAVALALARRLRSRGGALDEHDPASEIATGENDAASD